MRVAVQPFETLTDSGEARSLARTIPNEVVDALGDSQIEAVLGGEQAGRDEPRTASSSPGLIVTGILRDDGRFTSVDVRIEDGASHAALWSTEFKRNSREASDLPLEVAARVTDLVNMVDFARSADPPLTDNSALSALLQTADMIRDPRAGDWAQLIDRAQGIVARHPDFAFGHSVLAAAYGAASENIDVPDRAKAMRDAAQREANLALKLDPQDAGAYAILPGFVSPDDYRAQEALLLRGIKFAKHPKEPLGALYQYEGVLLDDVGRLREGLSYQLIAQATDQWSPSKAARLALDYANMGNLPSARGLIQKAIRRWPNQSGVRHARLYIAAFYEPPSDALAAIKLLDAQASPNQDSTTIWQSFIRARMAHSGGVSAATIRDIREAAAQGEISRETEIMMVAGLGDTKQAIEITNLALDDQRLEPKILFTPVMRNVRRDPGFVGLAARMSLIKYWRETGKRPDFCTDQATRSECSPQLLAALKS
jgi:tetratricopeptide (TPR) repeat protein